jgi:excisionase family DNA binding protein
MQVIECTATKRYTIDELARVTNMSTAFWRKRIWLQDIEVERFGRSIRVTAEALERYLAARRRAA